VRPILILAGFLAILTPLKATAIDIVGRTYADFDWQQASGPVTGYAVYVSRDGSGFSGTPERYVSRTTSRVTGSYGESIVVRVAALDAAGSAGPLSEPADEVRFVEPTPTPTPVPTPIPDPTPTPTPDPTPTPTPDPTPTPKPDPTPTPTPDPTPTPKPDPTPTPKPDPTPTPTPDPTPTPTPDPTPTPTPDPTPTPKPDPTPTPTPDPTPTPTPDPTPTPKPDPTPTPEPDPTPARFFTAYNDLAWGTGQLDTNITVFTAPSRGSGLPSSGPLVDFQSGALTGVTVTVTGGRFVGDTQAAHGADALSGTEAFNIFDGRVSTQGTISYVDAANSPLILRFQGMSPTRQYDLDFHSHRDKYAWDRASLVEISGADAFRNRSSNALDDNSDPLFLSPLDPTTRLPADNDAGYVATFEDIDPGSDGEFVVAVRWDGSDPASAYKGKYASAFRLVEHSATPPTPTPATPTPATPTAQTPTPATPTPKPEPTPTPRPEPTPTPRPEPTPTPRPEPTPTPRPEPTPTPRPEPTPTPRPEPTPTPRPEPTPTPTPRPAPVNMAGAEAKCADFDGDGHTDLFWHDDETGYSEIWLMANPASPEALELRASPDPEWKLGGVGDFDGDGLADVFWRNTETGENAIWLLDGAQLLLEVPLESMPSDWQVAGVGDFDSDGSDDVLWRNLDRDHTTLWTLHDAAVVRVERLRTRGLRGWLVAGVADYTGDGRAEVLWHNDATGDNTVWSPRGEREDMKRIPSVESGWALGASEDFDADGRADLFWTHSDSGENMLWTWSGRRGVNKRKVDAVNANWELVGAGDHNGDGVADLVWRNVETGSTVLWVMNEEQVVAEIPLFD
jgi:hypothetical protein